MSDIHYRITELERRVANMLQVGTIAEVDHGKARASVSLGDLTTALLPWLTTRAMGDRTWWAPEPGEQVLVLSPSGDPAQAVILPALYQIAALAPAGSGDIARMIFDDETSVEYDRASHTLTLDIKGDTIVNASGNITAHAKQSISATADVAMNITTPFLSATAPGGGDVVGTLKGSWSIEGGLNVDGNIHATGSIIDQGGNTPNHAH